METVILKHLKESDTSFDHKKSQNRHLKLAIYYKTDEKWKLQTPFYLNYDSAFTNFF
jgi:hypothetical protein